MRKVKKTRGWNIYCDDAGDTLIAYPPDGTICAVKAQIKTASSIELLIKQIKEVPNERIERRKSYYSRESKAIDQEKKRLRKEKVKALRAAPRKRRSNKRADRADPKLDNYGLLHCRDPC